LKQSMFGVLHATHVGGRCSVHVALSSGVVAHTHQQSLCHVGERGQLLQIGVLGMVFLASASLIDIKASDT